jgi:carboxylesterase type B
MFVKILLIVCAIALLLKCLSQNNGPTVLTQQGILRGTYLHSRHGRMFSAFQGVPYAHPPVGDLRFQVRDINFKISKHYCCILKCKMHDNCIQHSSNLNRL